VATSGRFADEQRFVDAGLQVDGSTGALKANTAAPNRIIVGAGVSTCAPTQIQ